MALPKIGVEAVVDNLDGYKKAMKTIETSNDAASSNVAKTAKSFDVLGTASKAAGTILTNVFSTVLSGLVLKFLDVISNAIGSIISKIGDLVSGIFNAGVDFSKTMANISSVTKQTGGSLAQLSKDLIEIGADSAAGPQAVANAYYDVASGVLDASKRLDILKAAIATSEAGQADLTATTQGLISVMNAYGDAAGGATKVSDVFTETVAQGVGTMDQFVGALSPLAGLAATNKISFTELGAAISYMTAKGIPAEQAATAIKAAMVQLSRNTPQVVRALRAVGEKSVSASIAAHGLAGTLELLQKGAKKTGQNFTTMIGSVEALQAANSLGTEEFQKYFDTFIDGVDGATAAARELQRADVSYQLKLMQSRFQAVGLSIAGAVLPAFNKLLTFVNQGFKNFNWKAITAGLDKLGEKLGTAAGNLIGKLGAALDSVDWDGLADDIMNTLSKIGDFFMNIDWSAVATAAKGVFDWLREAFFKIQAVDWGKVGSDLSTFVNNAVTVLTNIGTFIGNLFTEISKNVNGFILGVSIISGQVSQAFTDIGGILTTAQANISGGFQMIGDGLSTIWNSLFGPTGSVSMAVSTTFDSVYTFLGNAWTNITGGFQMIGDGLSTIWNSFFGPTGSVSTAVSTAFTTVQTWITTGQTNITTAIQAIVDAVTGIWDYYFGAEGQISQAVSVAMDTVNQFINDNLTPIGAAITAIVTGVQSTWDTYFGPTGSISTAVSTALNNVATIVRGMASAIGAAFNAIASAVMAALAPAIATVNGLVAAASALLGMAGGGNNGGAPGGAAGGNLQEGLNIVGEQGAEAVIKQGNKVTVIPHNKSREILATVGDNITPLSHQGQINPMKFLPKLDMGGVFSSVGNISPQATPITAGAHNHHHHEETTNNRNIGAIIFNGIHNNDDAQARMSMLRAAKKF
jgi:TP901 family phage tail tape measure protein